LPKCKHIEFLCSELEYENPNLEITGVDFKSDDAVARLTKSSQERAEALKKEIEKFDTNTKTFHEYFKKRAEYITKNKF
jgi:adenylate kinase family enzyme